MNRIEQIKRRAEADKEHQRITNELMDMTLAEIKEKSGQMWAEYIEQYGEYAY